MGKRKSSSVPVEFQKRRKQQDGLTPKQRQMLVEVDEGQTAGNIDSVRSWKKDKTENGSDSSKKLPVLGKKGSWKAVNKEACSDQEGTDVEDAVNKTNTKQKATDWNEKSFEQVKTEMANIVMILSESAEPNTKKLGEFRTLCDPGKHQERADGRGSEIVQMAMISCLTAVKDLMPGYAIRALSAEEQTALVSKEVKAVRSFEQSFLSHYKTFLQRLHKNSSQGDDEGIRFVAIVCLADLLESTDHFNGYEDVVKWVALGALGNNSKIADHCCQAIIKTFREDQYGRATSVIIRCMSDIIKDRDYQATGRALNCFLEARIRTDIAGQLPNAKVVKAPRGKKNMSKRDKKEMKKRLVELQKISDAEALVSKEEQEKWNSEALRYLFRVYFGILKKQKMTTTLDTPTSNAATAEVMQAVLKGLAHFAHLISKDEYFGDLLRALKAVIDNSDKTMSLSLEASFQLILTVARIQAMQERALAVDIKFIYTFLFRQLDRMKQQKGSLQWDPQSTGSLLGEVLKTLLGPRLHLPSVRLAAFAQKLSDLAAALAEDEVRSMTILGLLQAYLGNHQNVRLALLDRECFGQGAYMAACADPDLCNPYSRTICIPLDALLKKSPSARVKSMVGRILSMSK